MGCLAGLKVGTSQGSQSLLHMDTVLLAKQELWEKLKPEIIIQFGGRLTSKRTQQFLEWSANHRQATLNPKHSLSLLPALWVEKLLEVVSSYLPAWILASLCFHQIINSSHARLTCCSMYCGKHSRLRDTACQLPRHCESSVGKSVGVQQRRRHCTPVIVMQGS